MVELRTRNRVIRRFWGNHHEKLGLKRISCVTEFNIPDMAGMRFDLECNYSDMRSSLANRASWTRDYSYPLVSSTSLSSSSRISLFLFPISIIIAEPKVQSSLSISPSHNHELEPSIAYPEFVIHRVQLPSMIICLSFIVMIPS
jgi:hypothetical protein